MKKDNDFQWRELQLQQWQWANMSESDGLGAMLQSATAADARLGAAEDIYLVVQMMLVSALTPQQRRVLELYYFEGRKQVDVAHALGITQATVSQHLHGKKRGSVHVGGALRKLQKAIHKAAKRCRTAETTTSKIILAMDRLLQQPTKRGRVKRLMAELTSSRTSKTNRKID